MYNLYFIFAILGNNNKRLSCHYFFICLEVANAGLVLWSGAITEWYGEPFYIYGPMYVPINFSLIRIPIHLAGIK